MGERREREASEERVEFEGIIVERTITLKKNKK